MTEAIKKEPHKILKIEVLHEAKFLKTMLSTYEYTNRVGDRVEGKWEWISRNGQPGIKCDAVVIAAIHVDPLGVQRLVVTEEGRVPISDVGEITTEYGFPAGLVDAGKTPHETVVSEVWQETGLKVKEILDFPAPLFISSAGMSNEAVRIFYALVEGEPTDENLEQGETVQTHLMDWNDLDALLRRCESDGVGIGGKAGGIMMQQWQQGYIGFRNPNHPPFSMKIQGNRATIHTEKGEQIALLQSPAPFEVEINNPAIMMIDRITSGSVTGRAVKGNILHGDNTSGVTIDTLG